MQNDTDGGCCDKPSSHRHGYSLLPAGRTSGREIVPLSIFVVRRLRLIRLAVAFRANRLQARSDSVTSASPVIQAQSREVAANRLQTRSLLREANLHLIG